MPARLFQTDLDRISTEVLAHPDQETGGSLYGAWSHTGKPLVYVATGPGPGARHGPASFYPCDQHMARTGRRLFDQAGLQHIGEWHSHHRLGLAQPSTGDVHTVWRGMDAHRLPRFVLGIANIEGSQYSPRVPVRFWLFDAETRSASELDVEHWPGESPLFRADRELAHAWTLGPSSHRGRGRWQVRLPRPTRRSVPQSVWYGEPAIKSRLARELKRLTAHPELDGAPRLRPDGDALVLTLQLRGLPIRWELRRGFPTVAPVVTADGVPWDGPWQSFEGIVGQVDHLLRQLDAPPPPLVREEAPQLREEAPLVHDEAPSIEVERVDPEAWPLVPAPGPADELSPTAQVAPPSNSPAWRDGAAPIEAHDLLAGGEAAPVETPPADPPSGDVTDSARPPAVRNDPPPPSPTPRPEQSAWHLQLEYHPDALTDALPDHRS